LSIASFTVVPLPRRSSRCHGRSATAWPIASRRSAAAGLHRIAIAAICVWMIINIRSQQPFDPYPYILLNLVLSCLAALQAPVIMMSQNRQAVRDRLDAQHDYEVNTRAELENRRAPYEARRDSRSEVGRAGQDAEQQLELLARLGDR